MIEKILKDIKGLFKVQDKAKFRECEKKSVNMN